MVSGNFVRWPFFLSAGSSAWLAAEAFRLGVAAIVCFVLCLEVQPANRPAIIDQGHPGLSLPRRQPENKAVYWVFSSALAARPPRNVSEISASPASADAAPEVTTRPM